MVGRWRKGPNGKILKRFGSIVLADTCCCGMYCFNCPYGTAEEGWPASDPVVDTLYARLTAVDGCECLDGLCIPLAWYGVNGHVGGGWSGTGAVPCTNLPESDRYITLGITCCQVDENGDPSNTFWLGTDDCTGGSAPGDIGGCPPAASPVTHVQAMESGGTCRPYSMTFLNVPGLTCCGVMPATFTVEISETAC